MATKRERLAAIAETALATGKTRQQVFDKLAPTWTDLELGDRVAILYEIATTREPGKPAPANSEIAKLAAQQDAEANAGAVLVFRRYTALKETNPFAAAALMNSDPTTITRGRELAAQLEPPDPGPQAA